MRPGVDRRRRGLADLADRSIAWLAEWAPDAPSTQVFPFDAATLWPAEIDGRSMDSYHRWMETVAPWTLAGTLLLGMPAGFDALRLGYAYEEATQWVQRVRPPLLDAGPG